MTTFFVLFAMYCPNGMGGIAGMTEEHPTMTAAWIHYFQFRKRYVEGLRCKELESVVVTRRVSKDDSLTYTKDIKPIFKNRCSKCHDYMEGRNWQKYKNAFQYRYSIRNRVANKSMPLGEDMPQAERDTIIKWVDAGSKE